ncbi:unnamed protein product [Tilletia caries]|nr:unnamed protein product [Tilletia caries]
MSSQNNIPTLQLKQEFDSVAAFKLQVRAVAAAEGWNAKYHKSEASYTIMRCHHDDCTFRVRAKTTNGTVKITRLVPAHTCLGVVKEGSKASNGNHHLVVAKVTETMVVTAQSSGKAMQAQLKHSLGHEANVHALYKAKRKIMGASLGDEVASFRRVPAYVDALIAADKHTHAVYEAPNNQFERLFVCPGASRHAWGYCRRWVTVDATFMKNKYTMRLHLAATMDGTGSLIVLR